MRVMTLAPKHRLMRMFFRCRRTVGVFCHCNRDGATMYYIVRAS